MSDRPGKVYLVGAGPGAADLITVRGARILERAQVILYDRLVGRELLELAPSMSRCVFVGKLPGRDADARQRAIVLRMIREARAGRTVVRLKGGDPFVFGRGGEERQALLRAGIEVEVVPGISAALAAPALAGIPLTHRDVAHSFAVFTGHAKADAVHDERYWNTAAEVDTSVFLMAVGTLDNVVDQLLQRGRSEHTPIAVISCASTPNGFVLITTLGQVLEQRHAIQLPATLVIGDVVRLREPQPIGDRIRSDGHVGPPRH